MYISKSNTSSVALAPKHRKAEIQIVQMLIPPDKRQIELT